MIRPGAGMSRRAALALAAVLTLAVGFAFAWPGAFGGDPKGGPSGKAMVGAYVGYDLAALEEFEGILGRPVDGVLEYTSSADWANMGPAEKLVGPLGAIGRGIFWSMPHYAAWESPDNGFADMRKVAAGARDADFVRWARELLARGTPAPDGNFYIRVAWEMPGEWFPWSHSARKDPAAFRESVCRFARALHGVSDRFKVVWDFISSRGPVEQWYAGDDCVDVISQDLYWTPKYQGSDPVAAFNKQVNGYSRGLRWMAEFAAARGKPMAISEFGVDPSIPGAEVWLELLGKWVRSHNVALVVYWYSDDAYAGKFGSNPAVVEAFRRSFGQ
jgi:Glycosyl hydrolase family 26